MARTLKEGVDPVTSGWASGVWAAGAGAVGLIVLAYVAGSLPTGYWMGLTKGIDIRTVGSGSTGATNVLRSVGKKEALVVFIADIAKGYLPVWWAMNLEASLWSKLGGPSCTVPVVVAGMTVVGHSRSLFLKFKGGKSAATGLGTCLALNPVAAAVVFATWLVVLGLSKIVSLASISAAIVAPFAFFFCQSPAAIIGFGVVGTLYVIVRHRANVTRLMNRTEPRIGKMSPGA
ncbi:glycerol-3-phosphate 1-O-acyltransferase PlsY [soil metagenome]